jgi:hypothetical protein
MKLMEHLVVHRAPHHSATDVESHDMWVVERRVEVRLEERIFYPV